MIPLNVLNEIPPTKTTKYLGHQIFLEIKIVLVCICECNAQLFYFVANFQKA